MASIATLRSILFDLDGTLLDTAPDLAAALNHVLIENGREPLSPEIIRPWASHGGVALIKNGFGIERNSIYFDDLRQQLLDYYSDNIAVKTRLFPGMEQVLNQLESADIKWGVVTNKPAWLTEPLLQQLDLKHRSSCIISGDTLNERKPHPLPLQHACRVVGCKEAESIYVGDAERDIVAGRQAGMPTLVAMFGYISESDQPENWGANALIETPSGILDWANKNFSITGLSKAD